MAGATKLMTAGGGGVILTPASSVSSDVTVSVPSVTGTVMNSGAMPAFSAYQSASQTLSNGAFTKLTVNTKEFDTATCYDATTNYRFTPNVAGYYQVNANYNLGFSGVTMAAIYKNGAVFKRSINATGSTPQGSNISCVMYLNGSTDYIEFYGYTNYASNTVTNSATDTWFQAYLVRAA